MKDELAETLLVTIMNWPDARTVQERPLLSRMANFKYDEYQQFGPGRKFIETLCLWLLQFETPQERSTAYQFVKDRLVFIGADDVRHLIETVFPDIVRPRLLCHVATAIGESPYSLRRIASSCEYQRALRSTLFLGLSDGAKTDIFRRSAGLNNEQVWQAYEIGAEKMKSMLGDLRKDLQDKSAKFERLVLIDDFSASGISYVRQEDEGWKGKVVKAIRQLLPKGDADGLVDREKLQIDIILYVATSAAVQYISRELSAYCSKSGLQQPHVVAVYTLPPELGLHHPRDTPFLELLEGDKYYRTRPMDDHELKGKSKDMKLGFAAGALPLVLSHNCPNNSIYILWADPLEAGSARGLFPRIVRHRET